MPDNFSVGTRVRVIDRGSWCYGRVGVIAEDVEDWAYIECPQKPDDMRLVKLATKRDSELARLFETRHLEGGEAMSDGVLDAGRRSSNAHDDEG